ncbi:MAG TPA: protein translocase subunit SecF [Candidatus Paceibacterota bacterium]
MFIVTHRKFFYAFSTILLVASVVAVSVWGLKPGIDFKGGSIIEVEYASSTRPTAEAVKPALNALNLGEYSVRETGAAGFIIRTKELTPVEHNGVLAALSGKSAATISEKRFDSVGPILGKEALEKSFYSIALVLIAIVLFITFAFRGVSRPVASWKYGVIAIVALIHNIAVPVGAFAVLGRYAGFEVDTLFVTALLVILGFSVHDTIVVFDRVRENLRGGIDGKQRTFDAVVGMSINQTFVRSINTSLTTLIAIFALYLVGAESTKNFSLALLIGILMGTYSSIFLGSPLLVTVFKMQEKKAAKADK